jgi:osmotically-inducible protein OsmY
MKTDAQLKDDVTAELEWDPSINASQVGVTVKSGIVTLTGHLDTYAQKYAIEKAVGRVSCVKAIAMELDVRLEPGHKRSDTEIATAIESALESHSSLPEAQIQVKVEKGWVSLKGLVNWEYQRHAAEKAVRSLTGVVGVSNGITLIPTVTPANVVTRIREAFIRHAECEANHIDVVVSGSTITLRGEVDSIAERAAAFHAAWSAPGISIIANEIKVRA